MTSPHPYLLLPGTASEALEFYQRTFGGELVLHTFEEFGRTDGAADAIAHGMLRGPVTIYAADAAREETPLRTAGLMMTLLGAAETSVLRTWFAALAEGGEVIEPLARRAWNASDGQVRDRFGLHWLIGYEHGDGEIRPTRAEDDEA